MSEVEIYEKCCDCCLTWESELQPFITAKGEPLKGDFNEQLLTLTKRPISLPDEGADRIYSEFFGEDLAPENNPEAVKVLCDAYGTPDAFYIMASAQQLVDDVWLCRKCVGLELDEYFAKRREAFQKWEEEDAREEKEEARRHLRIVK